MIQVREKLQVNAEQFFKQLGESVAYDISETIGKEFRIEQIHEGYRYQKQMKNKMGMKGNVEVHIVSWKPCYCYEVEFFSFNGVNRLKYEIEDVEEGIYVNYMESFEGKSKMLDWNFKIVSGFMRYNTKRRIKRLLHAIEKHLMERN